MKKSLCHIPAAAENSDVRIDNMITDTPAASAIRLPLRLSIINAEEMVRIKNVSLLAKMKYECHPSSEILYWGIDVKGA